MELKWDILAITSYHAFQQHFPGYFLKRASAITTKSWPMDLVIHGGLHTLHIYSPILQYTL